MLEWPRDFVFTEIGKNINQDKALSLKRYVEDYHKYVNSLNFPSVHANKKKHKHEQQRARKTKGKVISLNTQRDTI